MPDMPWTDVEPLPHLNGDLHSVLDSVWSLRRAWKAVISTNDRAFAEARQRSLRRHAIETGIIERLYNIDWGVTEALVAEGITADAVARAGEAAVPENVLATVRSQYDTLQFLVEAARDGRDVSVSLIKELHCALTRTQPTYEATGPDGRVFQATLHRGEWKHQASHVTRPDGSVLEYTPPEQVGSQMDRMVELFQGYVTSASAVDPIVQAAWLHHRFVRIHPFEDGNGRVARCLTLLTLLKHDLAPLVVDRRERDRYLRSLDQANEGDLRPLVRFFAELEIAALRSELERPVEADPTTVAGGAVAVLEMGLDRLRELQRTSGAAERAEGVAVLANTTQQLIDSWLEGMAHKFDQLLRDGVDMRAHTRVVSSRPPHEESHQWRRQVVRAARSVGFYANLHDGVWWSRLRVIALGQELRYLVFLQKVGRGETGVLTMTVYAEIMNARTGDEPRPDAEEAVVSTPTETVTWTHTDSAAGRWDEVAAVLDMTLAAAVQKFTSSLG